MLRRKDDFSYSPGQLAKKLGVCTRTVKNYLDKTGLIKQCYRDDNGWWRIPASVAIKFVPAESLAVPQKHQKKKGRKKVDDNPDNDFQEEFAALGLVAHQGTENRRPPKALTPAQKEHERLVALLRQAGISNQDVLAFFEQQLIQCHIEHIDRLATLDPIRPIHRQN